MFGSRLGRIGMRFCTLSPGSSTWTRFFTPRWAAGRGVGAACAGRRGGGGGEGGAVGGRWGEGGGGGGWGGGGGGGGGEGGGGGGRGVAEVQSVGLSRTEVTGLAQLQDLTQL